MKQKSLSFILITGVALVLTSIFIFRKTSGLMTTRPQIQMARETIHTTGIIKPGDIAVIKATSHGIIKDIEVHDDDLIHKNKVLAYVQTEASDENNYDLLISHHRELKEGAKRLSKLLDQNHDKGQSYKNTIRELNSTNEAIIKHKELIDHMAIKSPVDGIILTSNISLGSKIKPGDLVMTIGDTSKIIAEALITSAQAEKVRLGQKVLVKPKDNSGKIYTGRIAKIENISQDQYKIEVLLNKNSLVPGRPVVLKVIIKEVPKAIMVPTTSIIDNKVLVKNGRNYEKRPIKSGIIDGDYTQLLDGLNDDEEIILDPRKLLEERPARDD